MHTDFLILGSGIAGLSLALKLSKLGKVTILTKKGLTSGSTGLAQGGIAGVRNFAEDSSEQHFQDTLKAGAYHNDPEAVRLLVDHGQSALEDLEQWGVKFDFSLHREGGHTYARIFHVADETGRVVQEILAAAIHAEKQITIVENAFAVALLQKNGAIYGVSFFHEGKNKLCIAKKTILATGGAGQIYAKTTNPQLITGDGIAMAVRAGAALKDMEFVQFHPTALNLPRDPLFLLSEALRGAGAKLVNSEGTHFVDELEPRDIVARAIFSEQKAGRKVFLDFRHEREEILKLKFPMIFDQLITFGLNLAHDLIPVTPAAHFFCGGVHTDLWGRTTLPNLFAVGEVACTGVHGANRLASNSLLEGVVFAARIFENITAHAGEENETPLPAENEFKTTPFSAENEADLHIKKQIQTLMQEYVGVLRTKAELEKAAASLQALQPQGTETKNLLLVASEVTQAALARKESLGCHFISS